ncbi:hypothetical protein [Rhodopirellula europaea]|uniref:hypothetical protein n=1 Tax=Rhodopirellula europaea TaxID=1263866 RepID=UPI001F38FDFA|nr:hypothetical protein [Rhodopirellula europaea]
MLTVQVLLITAGIFAIPREVDSQQDLSGITIGLEGRKQKIGEAEHASKEHAQKREELPLGREAFTPGDPSCTEEKVNEKVRVELRPPVERHQVVDRDAWPVDPFRKRSNHGHCVNEQGGEQQEESQQIHAGFVGWRMAVSFYETALNEANEILTTWECTKVSPGRETWKVCRPPSLKTMLKAVSAT